MLLFIFTAALILRLIGLNQSLWLDEATTANVVHNLSYGQILTSFSPTDFHPPFYYLFMKVWTSFFGISETALRFPSVVFSLLTGYVIFLIGKKYWTEKTGLWAAALFLFNPLIMYYSQEARMYLMATFFLAAALYFYLAIEKNKYRLSDVIWCNLFIFLSFITFYGSGFFISALYVYLIMKKKFRQFAQIHPGFLLPLILLLPLIMKQLQNARTTLQIVANWSQVLGKTSIKNLFLIPVKFSIGRISFEPKLFYYLISVPWTLFVWFLALSQSNKKILLIFLLFFPLFLGVVFSIFSPLLQYFRFIYLIPIVCLLIALSVKNKFVLGSMVAGFMIFSGIYLLFPQYHREDWKSLSSKLPYRSPVYIIKSSSDPLQYYRKDLEIRDLKSIELTSDPLLIIIPYTADIYGFDYKKTLLEKGYRLFKTESVHELQFELWQRSSLFTRQGFNYARDIAQSL